MAHGDPNQSAPRLPRSSRNIGATIKSRIAANTRTMGPHDLEARAGGGFFGAHRAPLAQGIGLDPEYAAERAAALFRLDDSADELAYGLAGHALPNCKSACLRVLPTWSSCKMRPELFDERVVRVAALVEDLAQRPGKIEAGRRARARADR